MGAMALPVEPSRPWGAPTDSMHPHRPFSQANEVGRRPGMVGQGPPYGRAASQSSSEPSLTPSNSGVEK